MKCYFRSFDVGPGDCNVIRLVKSELEQYAIMVDCGKYTKSVRKYVKEVLRNHINLLIVTHIDGDHIQGLTRMLKDHRDLQIGEIWYNCYGRTRKDEQVTLTEQQWRIFRQLQKVLPLEFDAIHYREINAEQGSTLAETILANEAYKQVWRTEDITKDMSDYKLPEGYGKIVILGPHPDALKEIEKKFKEAFDTYFMQAWNESIANGEELQELLTRLVDSLEGKFLVTQIASNKERIYDATFVREQAKAEDVDKSDTNYSSIAFMLECGEHRVLMLGDAFASTIEETIDAKFANMPKPISCDAIKVSHHGSNRNNSKALYERIDSHLFFIPGGKSDQYPTFGTLGRIAETHKDGQIKKIVFSFGCDNAKNMHEMSAETKSELGIDTEISELEYELFEW